MNFKAKQGDFLLGVLAIAAGAVILFLTKMQNLAFFKSGKLGPGFFPTVCGIAILICGVMVLVEWRFNTLRAKKDGALAEEMEKNILNLKEIKNLLLFMILGGMVLVLSEYIGLLSCLGICVIAYLKIWGKESWIKSIIIGVCMVAFLYGVFVLFLRVPVPKGPLGF